MGQGVLGFRVVNNGRVVCMGAGMWDLLLLSLSGGQSLLKSDWRTGSDCCTSLCLYFGDSILLQWTLLWCGERVFRSA